MTGCPGKNVRFQGEMMQEPHLARPMLFLLVQIMGPVMPCALFLSISGISDKAEVLLGHTFRLASDFAVSGPEPGWLSSSRR